MGEKMPIVYKSWVRASSCIPQRVAEDQTIAGGELKKSLIN